MLEDNEETFSYHFSWSITKRRKLAAFEKSNFDLTKKKKSNILEILMNTFEMSLNFSML